MVLPNILGDGVPMADYNESKYDKNAIKRIAVSSKRQISIPKEFFDQLGIGKEVFIQLSGNQLIIKPIHDNFDDFSELILRDLIAEGIHGEELIKEFRHRKSQMGSALTEMLIHEKPKAKKYTLDDLDDLFVENDEE